MHRSENTWYYCRKLWFSQTGSDVTSAFVSYTRYPFAQALCGVCNCALLPRMTVHPFRAELLPCWHADGGQPRHLYFPVMLTALRPEVD